MRQFQNIAIAQYRNADPIQDRLSRGRRENLQRQRHARVDDRRNREQKEQQQKREGQRLERPSPSQKQNGARQRNQKRRARDENLRPERPQQHLHRAAHRDPQPPPIRRRLDSCQLPSPPPDDESHHRQDEESVRHVRVGGPLPRRTGQQRGIAGDQQKGGQ